MKIWFRVREFYSCHNHKVKTVFVLINEVSVFIRSRLPTFPITGTPSIELAFIELVISRVLFSSSSAFLCHTEDAPYNTVPGGPLEIR